MFTPSAPLSRLLFHFRSADDNVKTLPESLRCRGASFTRIPGADTERGDDVVDKAQAWKRWCVGARECRRNHGSPLRKITKEKKTRWFLLDDRPAGSSANKRRRKKKSYHKKYRDVDYIRRGLYCLYSMILARREHFSSRVSGFANGRSAR